MVAYVKIADVSGETLIEAVKAFTKWLADHSMTKVRDIVFTQDDEMGYWHISIYHFD